MGMANGAPPARARGAERNRITSRRGQSGQRAGNQHAEVGAPDALLACCAATASRLTGAGTSSRRRWHHVDEQVALHAGGQCAQRLGALELEGAAELSLARLVVGRAGAHAHRALVQRHALQRERKGPSRRQQLQQGHAAHALEGGIVDDGVGPQALAHLDEHLPLPLRHASPRGSRPY